MKKKLLLTTLICLSSISITNAMCVPSPIPAPCKCAHPIIENGHLACGPTYCPNDTTCMLNGACCKTEKVCGSLSTKCCKDNENCIDGISCCPDNKPYVDASGNCVECTTNEHCMKTTDSCGICSNGTCVASDAKCPQTMYCDANFACMCDGGYTACSDNECCSSSQTCVNNTKCCPTNTPYLDPNSNCVQCTTDAHCADGKACNTTTYTCDSGDGSDPQTADDLKYCGALQDEYNNANDGFKHYAYYENHYVPTDDWENCYNVGIQVKCQIYWIYDGVFEYFTEDGYCKECPNGYNEEKTDCKE